MNQSFEKALKEKIKDYSETPSSAQKERLFAALPPNATGPNRNLLIRLIAAIILFISIPFYLLDPATKTFLTDKTDYSGPGANKTNLDQGEDAPLDKLTSQAPTAGAPIPIAEKESLRGKDNFKAPSSNQKKTAGASSNSTQIPERIGNKRSKHAAHAKPFQKIIRNRHLKSPTLSDTAIQRSAWILASDKVRKNILKVDPYAELGVFFLYQQVTPDISDDLIVENFESLDRLSPRRLGGHLALGVSREIAENIDLSMDVNFSVFQQNLSFDARAIEPSSAELDAEGNTLTSVFERSNIQINQTIFATGLQLGASFYALPNKLDALYTGVGYSFVIDSKRHFLFEDQRYQIAYPNQLLMTFGLRKKLFRLPSGDLTFVPNIRYSFFQNFGSESPAAISIKPFSVGLSISYKL